LRNETWEAEEGEVAFSEEKKVPTRVGGRGRGGERRAEVGVGSR